MRYEVPTSSGTAQATGETGPGKVGIVSYGHYVPTLRVDMRIFAEQWGLSEEHERMFRLNGRNTVSVQAADEDAVTLAIDAAERALAAAPAGTPRPESLLLGSESHPYAVKPSAVIVAEALGLTPDLFAADLEFACKGGTAAALLSSALARAGYAATALAIGADCPQSAPGTLLEASVGAGAAAILFGSVAPIATIDAIASAASDVTDFWRRDTAQFPAVVGKFSVDVGYIEHTSRVVEHLLNVTGAKPADYKYVCFHQPYASLPLSIAKKFGFATAAVRPGLISGRIGNTYSCACLLSLCAVLDIAEPGDRILVVSFGSGAGSDGFALSVTEHIADFRQRAAESGRERVADQLLNEHTTPLTYGQYALIQGKLRS
jgi:hydroxymethylglutaryl-CoA synthase